MCTTVWLTHAPPELVLVEHLVDRVAGAGEHVERQRLRAIVHEVDRLVDGARPRAPAGSGRRSPRCMIGASRSGSTMIVGATYFVVSSVRPPLDDGAAGRVEQSLEPVEVAIVDDARRSRGWPAWVGAVELVERLDHLVDEAVADRRLGEHVVGGDAGLAGVDELAPDDAAGGDVEVGVGGDDGGALAAELERDRREVLRRGLHHHPADRRSTPVKKMWSKRCSSSAVVSGRRPRRRRRRRSSRYLGISRASTAEHAGESSDGLATTQLPAAIAAAIGVEQQLDRVVPRRDDQRHAERLGDDPALRGHRRSVPGIDLGRLGPRTRSA